MKPAPCLQALRLPSNASVRAQSRVRPLPSWEGYEDTFTA